MIRLALSAVLFCALARADFDARHWKFRRAIQTGGATLAEFPIDRAIYAGSGARLDDVRILRGGREAPYSIEILAGSREEREFQPALLDKSAAAGGVRATLDQRGGARHNRLRIETPRRNFKQRVRIETSDDNRSWAVARQLAFILDFSQGEQRVAVLTVDYPESTRRYLRFTIYGWSDPADVARAWLAYFDEKAAVRDTVASLAPAVAEDAKEQSSLWTADLGVSGLAHDRASFTLGPGLFSRAARIETSADNLTWNYTAGGNLSRTAGEDGVALEFATNWDRYLRVRVLNRDSPPLQVRRMDVQTYRRLLRFAASGLEPCWIYYGNPEARQPSYDFGQTAAEHAAAAPVLLGAEEINPAYQAPAPVEKPWTDRHPEILYLALGAAVLVMGFYTVRMLLRVKAPGRG